MFALFCLLEHSMLGVSPSPQAIKPQKVHLTVHPSGSTAVHRRGRSICSTPRGLRRSPDNITVTSTRKDVRTHTTAVQATKLTHDTAEGSLDTATATMIKEMVQAITPRRATTMADECNGCCEGGCERLTGSLLCAACRCNVMYNQANKDCIQGVVLVVSDPFC